MTMMSSRDGDNTPANIFATRDDYEHEQFSQEMQLQFASDERGLSAVLGLKHELNVHMLPRIVELEKLR